MRYTREVRLSDDILHHDITRQLWQSRCQISILNSCSVSEHPGLASDVNDDRIGCGAKLGHKGCNESKDIWH